MITQTASKVFKGYYYYGWVAYPWPPFTLSILLLAPYTLSLSFAAYISGYAVHALKSKKFYLYSLNMIGGKIVLL